MFGGRKQSFCFLNWQRAKVLLKLEFDTEDQVLLPKDLQTQNFVPSQGKGVDVDFEGFKGFHNPNYTTIQQPYLTLIIGQYGLKMKT